MKITYIKSFKKKNIYRSIVLLVFFISFAWLCKALFLPGYPDFQVHYYGAQHILRGENPYLPDVKYFTHQVYPPIDMVFAIPFTQLDVTTASKVWIILSIASIILAIYLCCKMFSSAFLSNTSLLIYTLVFLSFPLKFTLGMGQINAIVLLFVVGVLYLIYKRKEYYAGILLALPVAIKFYPLLLIPYFAYLRQWKLLTAFIGTILLLYVITLFFFSPSVIYSFYTYTLPELLNSWKSDYYNQALSGFIARLVTDTDSRNFLRLTIPPLFLIANVIPILIKKKKSFQRIYLEIASLLIVSVLINNFSWQHHYVFLTIPFIVITHVLLKERAKLQLWVFLVISYILTSSNPKEPQFVPIFLQSHVFFGGFILWILSLYLLVKYKLS